MKPFAIILSGLNLGYAAAMHGQYSSFAECFNWSVGIWLAFIAFEEMKHD